MRPAGHNFINWPNLVSLIRILMVPVLFYLALMQQPAWFLLALVFTGFTDVLDGFLARRLRQITSLGSHLDSSGDFLVYGTMAVCAWLLWPDIIRQEWLAFTVIVASIIVPTVAGLIKFRTFTSYHTWSVKIAAGITYIGYLLLFSDVSAWPFRIAAAASAYAAVEEIAITLLSRHEHVDVRSVWRVLKNRYR